MNITEARQMLTADVISTARAFEICSAVALIWQDPRIELPDSVDLIVRLVARREELNQALPGADEMINDILRQAGLFPYIENASRWTTQIACEMMQVPSMPGITLHLEQMKVFGLLVSGKSVILSAPTSFGKSLIVDALISVKKPSCVVIVVPTLALLDEYRKRLRKRFPSYNVITHDYQVPIGGRNIYIGTQERIASRDIFERVNLFVIDEFYKLDLERGDQRALALNAVMARYAKSADQIYLLGPSIDSVSENVGFSKEIEFYKTHFSPVAADIIDCTQNGPNVPDLLKILKTTGSEPTLIFVRSPEAAARLAYSLMPHVDRGDDDLSELGHWLGEAFHPEWALAHAIIHGIGIHHGRIPRSIGQYVIHLFNTGKVPILICTSTLIEGVNTVAKNIVIYDKFVSTKKIDRFTYENIKGRAGRMFQHYVGRIYIFNTPPEEQELGIDIPLFNGFEGASEELIMHIQPEMLGPAARRKRQQVIRSSSLPPEVLQRWSRFGIDALNTMKEQIELRLAGRENDFVWSGYGDYKQIAAAFSLAWNDLDFEKHGMKSPNQAAFFSVALRRASTLNEFFNRLVSGEGLAAQKSIDQCFNFLRGAEYTFPEVLRATQDVIDSIDANLVDFSYFATSLQSWFLPGNLRTLEEFGVPLPLIQKMSSAIPDENPDEAYNVLRTLVSSTQDMFSVVEQRILTATFA